LKFLHDAFVLARLAKHLCAEKVRLAEPSAQWPDGLVQLEGKIRNIEVTSTHGGRKLGAEYRNHEGLSVEEDPIEVWVSRAESIPKYLDEAIDVKRGKCYGAPCWLVVYLNISEWGIHQKQIEAVIAEVKARYAPSFEAISVLWKGRFY